MDRWILSLVFEFEGKGIILYVLITCFIAAFLAFLIGLERQLRGEAAGVRTHALLAIGCSLLMTISIWAIRVVDGTFNFAQGFVSDASVSYDTSRIAAAVVTGIGFLGGGVIIKDKFSVRGLSTASTLWICAAIGLACGSGFVMEALIATGVTLICLIVLGKVLDTIDDHSPSVIVIAERGYPIIAEVRDFSDQNGLSLRNVRILRYEEGKLYAKINFAQRTDKTLLQYVCEQFDKLPHIIEAEPTSMEVMTRFNLK